VIPEYRKNILLMGILGTFLIVSAGGQTPEEFQKRRQAVRAQMEPNSVLILRSPEGPDSELERGFRQDSNLYYLTGIDQPNTALIVFAAPKDPAPGPAGPREILFYPPTEPPPAGGQWTAATKSLDRTGFESVRRSSDLQGVMDRILLGGTPTIYMDHARSRGLHAALTADEQILKAARDRGANVTVKPATPLFAPLRRIKSAAEIETLKTAATITAEAIKEVMRDARPGLFEYQLQSIIEHVFTFNGAPRPGFASIVGSGENSCILHWNENSRQTKAGDVAVIDIGAEYRMYTADITRTIPINGTFTKRQREIYEIVLRANEAAIEMVAPGVDMRDISERASQILAEGLLTVGLIKEKSELRKYYFHGMSHSIGLVVHDLGAVGKLEPGMVVTIEPGLYIREEAMGIRIEDDVVVTENGHQVITGAAPKKPEEVEATMKQGSMIFRYLLPASPM
jgi:Xaa-Pro aminopeptidase